MNRAFTAFATRRTAVFQSVWARQDCVLLGSSAPALGREGLGQNGLWSSSPSCTTQEPCDPEQVTYFLSVSVYLPVKTVTACWLRGVVGGSRVKTPQVLENCPVHNTQQPCCR